MPFDINITNFGKLSEAKVHVNNFTVFAGPNNTGKSTVSRALYSLFDAMNANQTETYIETLVGSTKNHWRRLRRMLPDDFSVSEELRELFGNLGEEILSVKEGSEDEFTELERKLPQIKKLMAQIASIAPKIKTSLDEALKNFEKDEEDDEEVHKARIEHIYSVGQQLADRLDGLQTIIELSSMDIFAKGLSSNIERNLIHNFQVPELSDLKGDRELETAFDISGVGKIKITNGDLNFDINASGVSELQNSSRVIYLESPIYWKLKNPLENVSRAPKWLYMRERERTNDVPKYFYDLTRLLKEKFTGNIAFPEVLQKLTDDVIGGKLAISPDTDELFFQEKERSFPLSVTAMGVINLGMLALLIEKKLLDSGTFLFIDEPEAHLHPAWQVKMVEILFELAKLGVNVVIATHSVDILKWLEVHVKEKPDDKKMIDLNKFSSNGENTNEGDFDEKMAKIIKELTDPFARSYIKGLIA